MGLVCSCLKDKNQDMNTLDESQVIECRMMTACEVQRPEWKGDLLDKEEDHIGKRTELSGNSEHDSRNDMHGEMETINHKESVSPHEAFPDSIEDNQIEEDKEGKLRRGIFGGLGRVNGTKKPKALLFLHSSAVSSPISGGLSPHSPYSPHSPHSASSPLTPLSASSRRSAEIVREFAERISRRILAIGRRTEDGMEIAWFCDRESEENKGRKAGVEGEEAGNMSEVDEIVEVVGGDPGEEDSDMKGGVGLKRYGNGRWKVVFAERPSEGGSMRLAGNIKSEHSDEMKEEGETEGEKEGCETSQTVRDRIEYYEKIETSRQIDDEVFIVNEEVWNVSMEIMVKAAKFGGIREDSAVVVV